MIPEVFWTGQSCEETRDRYFIPYRDVHLIKLQYYDLKKIMKTTKQT